MTITQTPTARPARLRRSPAFWLLLAGSVAALVAGLALAVPNIGTMTATLLDQTATGVEVYAGQAWVTLGAALAGAGAVGIALALALAAAAALIPASAPAVAAPAADETALPASPERDEVDEVDEVDVPETVTARP
jgi:hypothetical protein